MRVRATYDQHLTPRIYPLLVDFGRAAGLPEPFATSSEFCAHWNSLLSMRMACTIVAEKDTTVCGVLGSLFAPRLYWPGWMASETFFWIVPEYSRGLTAARLLKEFEEEARRRECVVAHVGHKCHYRAEEMARFYEKFGYRPLEVMYQKEL